jgi:hypothetical protein
MSDSSPALRTMASIPRFQFNAIGPRQYRHVLRYGAWRSQFMKHGERGHGRKLRPLSTWPGNARR